MKFYKVSYYVKYEGEFRTVYFADKENAEGATKELNAEGHGETWSVDEIETED